jgi:hypothetical protein
MICENIELIDYFVDNDPKLIGTVLMGKEIKSPDVLLAEDKSNIFVIIGCMEMVSSVKVQLNSMGFEENVNYVWAVSFLGNNHTPDFYHRAGWEEMQEPFWNDSDNTRLRAQAAASLVDFSKVSTVMDLGAGQCYVKEFLPEGVEYIPVDYLKRGGIDIICDFNQYEFPDKKADCVFLVGVLQYVQDWKWLVRRTSKAVRNGGQLVILGLNSSRIKEMHWRSFPFTFQIVLLLKEYGLEMVEGLDWRLYGTLLKFIKVS